MNASSLIGSWRNLLSLPTMVSETRWVFSPDGSCIQIVTRTQLDTGGGDESTRTCQFTLSNTTLTVVFSESTFRNNFSVAFSNGDLLLDGFRFRRIG